MHLIILAPEGMSFRGYRGEAWNLLKSCKTDIEFKEKFNLNRDKFGSEMTAASHMRWAEGAGFLLRVHDLPGTIRQELNDLRNIHTVLHGIARIYDRTEEMTNLLVKVGELGELFAELGRALPSDFE